MILQMLGKDFLQMVMHQELNDLRDKKTGRIDLSKKVNVEALNLGYNYYEIQSNNWWSKVAARCNTRNFIYFMNQDTGMVSKVK